MGWSYEDACDRGYDGPDPCTDHRRRLRRERNNMLDCRDPDHDPSLCPHCGDVEVEE